MCRRHKNVELDFTDGMQPSGQSQGCYDLYKQASTLNLLDYRCGVKETIKKFPYLINTTNIINSSNIFSNFGRIYCAPARKQSEYICLPSNIENKNILLEDPLLDNVYIRLLLISYFSFPWQHKIVIKFFPYRVWRQCVRVVGQFI